jgi:ATP-dependent Lon protease
VLSAVEQVDEADKIADMIASHLAVKIAEKQDLLETLDVHERLEKILGVMEGEIGALQVEKRVRNRVKRQMEKTQREYYLNEQMKAIQKELGEGEDGMNELDEIEAQLNDMKLPKPVREKATAELKKLRNMGPMSAEATVVRNYLEWILALPWKKASRLKKDIVAARAVLDADHYGLDKVKDRIVEFLAVQQRTKAMRGPIFVLLAHQVLVKHRLASQLPKQPVVNMCVWHLAAFEMKPKFAAIAAPISGQCPARCCKA